MAPTREGGNVSRFIGTYYHVSCNLRNGMVWGFVSIWVGEVS